MRRIWEWRPDAAIALMVAAALSLPWLSEWGRRALLASLRDAATPEECLVALAAEGDPRAVADSMARGTPAEVHGRGGVTPLIAASYAGQARVVALLLENGADANGTDCCGNTSLMYAALGNRVEVIQLLLAHGADPARCNNYGRSPMDQATDYSAREAEMLLRGRY